MNIITSIILFCGLFCSNFLNEKQKNIVPLIDTQLIKVDSLLWDLAALSKVPDVEIINEDTVRSLLYQSVDYNGKPTQVFAYYSNPDLISGKKTGSKKYPGIVLVHGGGGKAFKEWVEKWAAEGYAAIAMDLSGNGANGEKLKNGVSENKFQAIETGSLKDVWTYHAVACVILSHSLLLSFPEVDIDKTYSLVPKEQRTICIKPEMKHSHPHGWKPPEIGWFLGSFFNNSEPLINVTQIAVRDSSITMDFIPSPRDTIASVVFYFSNDTISINEKRQWEMRETFVPRSRDEKQESVCNISMKEYKYGFFSIQDFRNLTVSSEFIID